MWYYLLKELMKREDVVDYRYLTSIYTIHNNNCYTDIIFFWCQVMKSYF
jgi:hypothetical protein